MFCKRPYPYPIELIFHSDSKQNEQLGLSLGDPRRVQIGSVCAGTHTKSVPIATLINKYTKGVERKRTEPGSQAFRGSGNLGRHSASHLRNQSLPQFLGVGHEILSVRVFLGQITDEIGIVGVAHPVVRIHPLPSVNRDSEWDFLGGRWGFGLGGLGEGVGFCFAGGRRDRRRRRKG